MKQTGWQKSILSDFIKIKHGFAFKGDYITEIENKNILITPGNFKIGGGFKAEKFKYYTGEIPEDYILKPDDLIISMTDLSKEGDTLGFPAKVPYVKEKTFLHNQRIGLVQFLTNDVDKDFLYYLLCTKSYQKMIVNSASGSTVRHTSPTKITEYEFLLPPLPEQRAIAAVLSSFDDKIELLRSQNQTLEALAQALFKEWFVDFNFPNAQGKPYKKSDGKMVKSEPGEIPKNWKNGKLSDILKLSYGKALKTDNRTEGEFPVIGSSGIIGFHNDFLVNGPGIVIGRKGTMGSVVWIENNFYPIDTTFFVQDKLQVNNLYFHLFLLKRIDFNKLGSDSAVPGLNRESAYSVIVVIPDKKIINKFNETVAALLDKKEKNSVQIETLTILKHKLLPKLMKGDFKVNI